MIAHDAALPSGLRPPAVETMEREGVFYTSARWTPEALDALIDGLERAEPPSLDELRKAWKATVRTFLDPDSPQRQALDESLARFTGLSRPGVEAAVETVLSGVTGRAVERLLDQAASKRRGGLVAALLAANLPALAVQPLLPALALGRSVLLKSPSSEPLFAPAFVRALSQREPKIGERVAAVVWRGGSAALEEPVLRKADVVLAYGDRGAMEDLGRRVDPARLRRFGPKVSIGVLSAEIRPDAVADGLARDVALFDQRGCLSIQAVFTAGDARRLADELAAALRRAAEAYPPGRIDPVAAARVHQLRAEARLRGLHLPDLPLGTGTVVVDGSRSLAPTPGLRTVRIVPVGDLADVTALLSPWAGALQGAALAGDQAWTLTEELGRLGFSRFAAPGNLQSPDVLWHNGGEHPFDVLAGPDADDTGRRS